MATHSVKSDGALSMEAHLATAVGTAFQRALLGVAASTLDRPTELGAHVLSLLRDAGLRVAADDADAGDDCYDRAYNDGFMAAADMACSGELWAE